MTLRFDAGFDVAAFGSLKITDSASASDMELTTGTLCHIHLGSLIAASYTDVAGTFTSEFTAESVTAGVTFSGTTGLYTITAGVSAVNLTFGVDEADAGHVRAGQVLGFSTSPGAILAGASVTSDITPYFSIVAAMGGASNATDDYEGGQSEDAEAEDGTSYGVAPTSAPVYSDFTVPFEPRAAVYSRAAVAAAAWTWEHFYQQVRCIHPFAVTDEYGEGVTVHKLKALSDRFKPKRVVRGWRELHDIVMKTRVLGRI